MTTGAKCSGSLSGQCFESLNAAVTAWPLINSEKNFHENRMVHNPLKNEKHKLQAYLRLLNRTSRLKLQMPQFATSNFIANSYSTFFRTDNLFFIKKVRVLSFSLLFWVH